MAATITHNVRVTIKDDPKLLRAFINWQTENNIRPLFGYSDPEGTFSFRLEHGGRVERWIIDNEGKPDA